MDHRGRIIQIAAVRPQVAAEPDPFTSSEARRQPTDEDDTTAALRCLSEAAQRALEPGGEPRSVDVPGGMPLSVRHSLQGVADAQTLDDATGMLASMAAQPPVNVDRRVAGLLAVSLAVPTLLIASTIAGVFALEQQKSRMPRVTELSKAVVLLEIEREVNHQDKQQRVAAIETWIAGGYREVIEDRAQMDSFYALMTIPPQRRQILKRLIAEPPPTAEQTAAAKSTYEQLIAEDRTVVPAEIGFFSLRGLVFLAAVAWMELIWIPSLFTAVACRGGMLLWLFGLALVNRRGQRASRLRIRPHDDRWPASIGDLLRILGLDGIRRPVGRHAADHNHRGRRFRRRLRRHHSATSPPRSAGRNVRRRTVNLELNTSCSSSRHLCGCDPGVQWLRTHSK